MLGITVNIAVIHENQILPHHKINHDDIIEIRKQPRQARLQFYQRMIGGAEILVETEILNNKRDKISDDPFCIR
jgi:hypothetical protein